MERVAHLETFTLPLICTAKYDYLLFSAHGTFCKLVLPLELGHMEILRD